MWLIYYLKNKVGKLNNWFSITASYLIIWDIIYKTIMHIYWEHLVIVEYEWTLLKSKWKNDSYNRSACWFTMVSGSSLNVCARFYFCLAGLFSIFQKFYWAFLNFSKLFPGRYVPIFFVYTISNPSNKWYFIVTFYLLTYEGLIFRWRIQGFAKMNPILLIPFPSYWSEIKSCIHTDNVLIIPFWWRIGYKKYN